MQIKQEDKARKKGNILFLTVIHTQTIVKCIVVSSVAYELCGRTTIQLSANNRTSYICCMYQAIGFYDKEYIQNVANEHFRYKFTMWQMSVTL